MNIRFSPASEFPATGSHPAAASSHAVSQCDAVAGTYSPIRDGRLRPRSQAVPGSALRANSACGGRSNSTPRAPHYTAEQSFERGEVAQALLDILFVGAAVLLISSTAVAIAGSFFILFFVKT